MRHSDSNISALHPGALYTQLTPHYFHLIESMETISHCSYLDDFFQHDNGLDTLVAHLNDASPNRISLDNCGFEKLTARMTLDQNAAITVFEELGFKREAMLRDHVKDRDGKKHDLLILSHDVEGFLAQMHAYGLDEATGSE